MQNEKELRNKTRLTSVAVTHQGRSHAFFLQLYHNEKGQPILPCSIRIHIEEKAGLRRGDCYSLS